MQLSTRDGCHTDNRIHGRPDIMGHLGEEIRLGTARPVRSLVSIQERFLRLPVLFSDIRDIFGRVKSQNIAAYAVLCEQNRVS